jgi:hypothetical protein
MSAEHLDELGPIDYLVMEWDGDQPVTDEVMRLILDLVDRGMVRILDLGFMLKEQDGSVTAIDIAELGGVAEFVGATSGLLSQEDLEEAATVSDRTGRRRRPILVAFSGNSASIVTRLARLPSAGAQNSGIRVMCGLRSARRRCGGEIHP